MARQLKTTRDFKKVSNKKDLMEIKTIQEEKNLRKVELTLIFSR